VGIFRRKQYQKKVELETMTSNLQNKIYRWIDVEYLLVANCITINLKVFIIPCKHGINVESLKNMEINVYVSSKIFLKKRSKSAYIVFACAVGNQLTTLIIAI
jgi:hypothetical protein